MTDSYTFNTPIGFLTIREEEQEADRALLGSKFCANHEE